MHSSLIFQVPEAFRPNHLVDCRPSSSARYLSSGFNSRLQSPLLLQFFSKPYPSILSSNSSYIKIPQIMVFFQFLLSFGIPARIGMPSLNWRIEGYRGTEQDMKGEDGRAHRHLRGSCQSSWTVMQTWLSGLGLRAQRHG
jgi:hypothetical protein